MVDFAELGWNIALDSCFRQMHGGDGSRQCHGKTRN